MVSVALISHADGSQFIRTGACDGCASGRVAQCCTFLELPLARGLSADEQRWVNLHPGLSVHGQNVRIEVECGALHNGFCSLFGSAERPEMCVRYPELPGQLLEGCAYSLEKVSA